MAKKKNVAVKTNEIAKNFINLGVDDVPNLLDTVTSQIEAITTKSSTVKTTQALSGFGTIESLTNVETLIKAVSMIIGKEQAYYSAAKKVVPKGIKIPKFSISGASAEDWISDISARIILVANEDKLRILNEIHKKLESNLSAKDKFSKDLLEIQNILNENV